MAFSPAVPWPFSFRRVALSRRHCDTLRKKTIGRALRESIRGVSPHLGTSGQDTEYIKTLSCLGK